MPRFALMLLAVLLVALPAVAQRPGATRTETIVKSTYRRITLPERITKIAIADEGIVKVTELSGTEILALGGEVGRTTAILWLADGTVQEIAFAVERDLTVLRNALLDIDRSISVETAPDRDAVVLRGDVSGLAVSRAAELAARQYLAAQGAGTRSAQPVIQTPAGRADAGGDGVRVRDGQAPRAAVINLIRVQRLPGRLDDRLGDTLRGLGARDVKIRRVLRGDLPNDEEDVFILEGEVENQVMLSRVLTLASRTILGAKTTRDQIRVIADESGGLSTGNGQNGGGNGGGGRGGGGLGLGVGGGGGAGGAGLGVNLRNQIETNIGRAKVIEVGGGRILSFIKVRDLPQISVAIKLYEVNRTRLRNIGSNLAVNGSDFSQPALLPAGSATAVQGGGAARVGAQGGSTDVQNALAFLGGGLTNQLQLVTGDFALDSLLSVLEANDIARKLSEPTLTVLSGEQALFQVGGEIPVPQTFAADAGSGLAQGVFNSIDFVSFGVQLAVRPLVDEDDAITLDLIPQVVNPDPTLTLLLGSTTGAAAPTTAFETRVLRTTNRLADGQALVLGGLVNRTRTRELAETPGLKDVPLVQWLFRDFAANDDEIELVVIVSPEIVRDPLPRSPLWEFPGTEELLQPRNRN